MKLGIVRTGNVGCASVMAAAIRGSARKIVLVNRTRKTADAVAPLGRKVDIVVARAGARAVRTVPRKWTKGACEVGATLVACENFF